MVVKTEPKDTSIPAQTIPQARQKRTASKEEKSNALKEVADYRKAVAWQVHRWPLEKRLVQEKTKIHLPMSYHATAGVEVKTIWPGDDLNQVVHRYYAQRLTEDDEGKLKARNCTNFVTDDGLTLQRHEYLGPDPRIVGYRFDVDGEVHIKWWDGFLQDLWMEGGKWAFDVKQTDSGKWAEVDD